jgi:Fe(3+) dicitrate transport protein
VTNDADERLTAKIKALSYYAQNTFITGDWTFTPGLRIEDVTSNKKLYQNGDFANSVDSLTTSKTQLLPGFGMTWNGLINATVFGGVHRGFAPPRPDRDIDGSSLQHVTPELSTTTEVGIRSGILQSGYIEGTFFNMDITDVVVQSTGSGSTVFRNEGKAQHTGIELSSKFNFGELTGKKNNYFATVAYTNVFTAKFKGSGEVGGEGEDGYGSYTAGNRLPYAPEHTLALNLSYEDQQGLRARVGMTHVSKQFANTENFTGTSATGYCPSGGVCGLQGEIPALTLFNASLAYSPKGQQMTYFLNGENLADKKYFSSRANGLQAGRGRMVVAGVRYSF